MNERADSSRMKPSPAPQSWQITPPAAAENRSEPARLARRSVRSP